MERSQGFYSVLQYSPEPARMEYVNIGVLLFCHARQFIDVKFSSSPRRVEKLFGKINHSHFKNQLEAFSGRIKREFRDNIEFALIERFSKLRAQQIRMNQILPVPVAEPRSELERLFKELVGEPERQSRRSPVKSKLKSIFQNAGVLDFLDQPEPIELPEKGIMVSAPYGYQNGSYNLIDPIRLDDEDHQEALQKVGQKRFEGEWLAAHYSDRPRSEQKSLIVVADFEEQPDNFFRSVRDSLKDSGVTLYRMEGLGPLIKDIREHAAN